MAVDAAALARAFEPPVVVLPRLAWVPVIGRLLARILPPKRHVGRVLSALEFQPFQAAFARAFTFECVTCGKRKTACECPPERRDHRSPMPDEELGRLCRDFIRAQGFPVNGLMALPGSALDQVMQELFICQTRANLPRRTADLTNGSD